MQTLVSCEGGSRQEKADRVCGGPCTGSSTSAAPVSASGVMRCDLHCVCLSQAKQQESCMHCQ